MENVADGNIAGNNSCTVAAEAQYDKGKVAAACCILRQDRVARYIIYSVARSVIRLSQIVL
jgi:hypothetical protein